MSYAGCVIMKYMTIQKYILRSYYNYNHTEAYYRMDIALLVLTQSLSYL